MQGILRGKTSFVSRDGQQDTVNLETAKKNALHHKNEFNQWSEEMKSKMKEKARQNISKFPKRQ